MPLKPQAILLLSFLQLAQVNCSHNTCFPTSTPWTIFATIITLATSTLIIVYGCHGSKSWIFCIPTPLFISVIVLQGVIYSYTPCWINWGWTVYMMIMAAVFVSVETSCVALWIQGSSLWKTVCTYPVCVFLMTELYFFSLYFGLLMTLVVVESGVILWLLRGEKSETV
mmetsp:Transcript_29747/g.33828  ORF Transcript_29747/g.33828 Transcript_29747/m.33828 type:complete len:169 (-) Transcript_29747:150-656(-)